MAGTPTGWINGYFRPSYTASQRGQVVFKNIYEVMLAHPTAEIISLFYGSDGTVGDGNGTGYYWQTGSFRGGAFFVVKMPANANRDFDYYVLVQLVGTVAVTGNGLPLQVNGANAILGGLSFAAACVSGSVENPWNGTMNNNGTDAKGSPVWDVGVGEALVLPASNGRGGTDFTNKENTVNPILSSGPSNIQFVCDDDNIALLSTTQNFAQFNYGIYIGPYKTNAAVPVTNNLLLYGSIGSLFANNAFLTELVAGIIVTKHDSTNIVSNLSVGVDSNVFSSGGSYAYMPNRLFGFNPTYPINVYSYSTGSIGHVGIFGHDNGFCEFTYNKRTDTTNEDKTRAYFGSEGQSLSKLSIPWDGVTVPGNGFSISGSFF